ncbi:MAG: hypothetical protein APF81_01975 [Desulfosporosinus sp. BRH_c37]|nr:MAG: hypothetical protein APF81_01975 [Desulfosporosinus sp. BRH_c37]
MSRIRYVGQFLFAMLILLFFAQPALAENPPGMVTFTDGASDRIYEQAEQIGFRMGPFPCQANKTDNLVFGIMDRNGDFLTDVTILDNLHEGPAGPYLSATADAEGFFTVSGMINPSPSVDLPSGILAVKIYDADWKILRNDSTGAEAYIPVLDTSGVMALVLGKLQDSASPEPTLDNSLFKAIDEDYDRVYFDNQNVKVNFAFPGGQIPPILSINTLTVTSGIFRDFQTFDTTKEPIKDIQMKQVSGGLEITALINNPGNNVLPAGVLGLKLNFPANLQSMFQSMSTPMPVYSAEKKAAILGVAVPEQMLIESTPQLSELKNLYNTEVPITFTKGGQGSITFTPGLNIIDNRDQLAALDSAIQVNYDSTSGEFSFNVKTGSLSFLSGRSAGIKAIGVMQKLNLNGLKTDNVGEFIKINMLDDSGKTVPDSEQDSYLDRASISYDEATDVLTIPVKHFTTYQVSKNANTIQPPDDSKFTSFDPVVRLVTPEWQPKIRFSMPVDLATLGGISVWQLSNNVMEQVPVTVELDTSDPTLKTVIVKHSASWLANKDITLYIDSTVSAKTVHKNLTKLTKLLFRVK